MLQTLDSQRTYNVGISHSKEATGDSLTTYTKYNSTSLMVAILVASVAARYGMAEHARLGGRLGQGSGRSSTKG